MKNGRPDLKVLEQSIVPIYEGKSIDESNQTEQLINARDLWTFLKNGWQFTDWIKDRIGKYGFEENVDYILVSMDVEAKGRGGNRKAITEYILRLDVAKEIVMVENNDQGRMVRRYFIEAEKRFREEKLSRARSKAERRIFTDVLKEVLPESPNKKWAYKYYTDLVYKIVTGKNAKQLRELYGLTKDESVRGQLDPEQLKEIMNYERIIESLLELGHDYDSVKSIISNPTLLNPAKGA